MLTDNVRTVPKASLGADDVLSCSLANLFPDDERNQHGNSDQVVVYDSPRFGEVFLTLANPAEGRPRRLFAHYLWNASIWLAAAMSDAQLSTMWDVRDQSVLELGAGAGLGGITSALAGSRETIMTDYPDPTVLANLKDNIESNFQKRSSNITRPTVHGHVWGVLDDDFAITHKGRFSRVIAADCLWMPEEHRNLRRSIKHFLAPDANARASIAASFHTGRATVAAFFDASAEEGLAIDTIEEVDVEGNVRPWTRVCENDQEDGSLHKRWLVIATLKHSDNVS